jgi:hypothetical protein
MTKPRATRTLRLPVPAKSAAAPAEPVAVEPAPAEPAPVEPAPVTPAPVTPAPVAPAPVEPAPIAPAPATSDVIRMLVGQEGPAVSRVRGQELTIGTDIGTDEAQRLVDADFAERI